jgi:hypothetical protein
MRAPNVMAIVVTEAPLSEVRFAAAAHDFNFAVEPAAENYPGGAATARCYEVILLADGAPPRPDVARTLRTELCSLYPGTIVYDQRR